MSVKKLFLLGFLALSLASCASDSSQDKNDLDVADSGSTTSPAKDGTVDPDLAQDTMSGDLEAELNSAAPENESAPNGQASDYKTSDDKAATGNDKTKPDDVAADAASPEVDSAVNQPSESSTPEPPKLSEDLNPAPVPPVPAPLESSASSESNAPAESAAQAASTGNVEVRNIRYLATKNGGTVVVETSAPASYRTREVPEQNQFIVEIANATLPARLKRPFLTKDFNQEIASIDAYQDAGSSTARVVVQFRGPSSARVSQDGSTLTVAAAGATSSSDSDVAASSDSSESNQSISGQQPLSNDGSNPSNSPTQFFGKPISIEVRETNIRDVINLIAEQSGANIIVADSVTGNVTLKLRQIPWDQALLLIMKSKNLGYVRQGSVLRIAPNEQLQKEADDIRKIADAKLLAEPLRVRVIPVGYAKVEDLKSQVTNFLSTRGKVVADIRTTSLIVTDVVENLDRITNLVKALDTPPLQVLIEGKIVEATDSLATEFGIQWGASGQSTAAGGSHTIDPSFNVLPGNTANSGSGALFNVTYGTLNLLGNLSAKLNLYESRSLAKILSSPRIVTLNNQAANIKQIQQIPLSSTTIGTGSTTSATTYKPIELSLEVTPQITSTSDVLLNINVKREFLPFAYAPGSSAPEIDSREAKTNVMVRSGQTAVIGGIYQNDVATTEAGVPVLKDVPVLGWLFKNHTVNGSKNELLIFLTPRILKVSKATADTNNGEEPL
jgi:type IV pilus assembly protein PilQ